MVCPSCLGTGRRVDASRAYTGEFSRYTVYSAVRVHVIVMMAIAGNTVAWSVINRIDLNIK